MRCLTIRLELATNYIGNKDLIGLHNCVVIAERMVDVPLWRHAKELKPRTQDRYAYQNGNISYENFIKLYIENVLSKLNPIVIAQKYNGNNMLCYEKDYTVCHRNGFKIWLNEAGIDCNEKVLIKRFM